jgi:hypothetical protein
MSNDVAKGESGVWGFELGFVASNAVVTGEFRV